LDKYKFSHKNLFSSLFVWMTQIDISSLTPTVLTHFLDFYRILHIIHFEKFMTVPSKEYTHFHWKSFSQDSFLFFHGALEEEYLKNFAKTEWRPKNLILRVLIHVSCGGMEQHQGILKMRWPEVRPCSISKSLCLSNCFLQSKF